MTRSCGLLLLLTACEPGAHFVALDLRTDLVVSRETDTLEITLDDGEPMVLPLDSSVDYLAGARVIDFPALDPGPHRIDVRLLRSTSLRVARPIAIDVDSDLVVTALMTRDCRGVRCDDGDGQACVAGSCVAAACVPGASAVCGEAECAVDADCVAGAACGYGVCAEGTCLFGSDDTMCEADRPRCDPDIGCRDASRARGVWALTATTDTLYFGFSTDSTATLGGERYEATGGSDLFIQAREPDGETVRWTRRIGSSSTELIEDMTTLTTGELLVGGSAHSPDSLETVPLSEATSGQDALVAVLDSTSGDPIWGETIVGEDAKAAVTSVAAGPNNTIYALVCFESPVTVGALTLPAERGQDWGLVAFTPTPEGWEPAWALHISTGDPRQLAASGDGVYVVGGADEVFTIGGAAAMATAERSGFVALVDTTGTVQHVTPIGGEGWATLEDVTTDAMGRPYAVGELMGPATIGPDALRPDGDDALLVALEADGTVRWARVAGGPGLERAYRVSHDGVNLTWVARTTEPFRISTRTVGDPSAEASLVFGVTAESGAVVGGGTLTGGLDGGVWAAPWAAATTSAARVCAVGPAPPTLEPPFYRGRLSAVHFSCASL